MTPSRPDFNLSADTSMYLRAGHSGDDPSLAGSWLTGSTEGAIRWPAGPSGALKRAAAQPREPPSRRQ